MPTQKTLTKAAKGLPKTNQSEPPLILRAAEHEPCCCRHDHSSLEPKQEKKYSDIRTYIGQKFDVSS